MEINAKHSVCLRWQFPGQRSSRWRLSGWQLS